MKDLWYHNFEVLGVKTEQKPGPYEKNQLVKQDILFSFIDQAIEICQEKSDSVTGVELFCADGFYANYAAKKHRSVYLQGIDLSRGYLKHAKTISKLLDISDRVNFSHCDVMDLRTDYDFAICAGGLYHLSEPLTLLALLREYIKTLVIQTVVSMANTGPDYFETPAPGRKRGCRFSYHYLLRMVSVAGWEIQRQHENELEGNSRLEDRGSAYLLCT